MDRSRAGIRAASGAGVFLSLDAAAFGAEASPAGGESREARGGFSPFDLGEVVVRSAESEDLFPTTIAEVTAEDIERWGARDIGEALQLLPGSYFRLARSKAGHYVSLRGFEQEHILILIDGVPLQVPYEGLLNLRDIPVHNIAKIKVMKGVASALYGPNTTGGVINIITKKGTETPSASFAYEMSDFDTRRVILGHGWKKGPLSYYAGFAHRSSDGWRVADRFDLPPSILASMAAAPSNPATIPHVPIASDRMRRADSDSSRDTFTLTANLDLAEGHRTGASFEYYDDEYGIPPVPIYRETGAGRFFWFPRYWRFSDWTRYTASVFEESEVAEWLRIRLRVYYDDYDNTLDIYDGPDYRGQARIAPPSGEYLHDDYDLGASATAFFTAIPRNEIRAGFSFRRDEHREKLEGRPFDTFASHTVSFAIEDEISILDNLSITPGASYDIFDKRKRSQASAPTGRPGDDVAAFNPLVGASYRPADALRLYGSVGRKVRFPTMRNLYADGIIGPQGDPDLREQRATNVEVGGSWRAFEGLELEAAGFYSAVRNMINFDNLIGRFEQYRRARIAGIEIGPAARIAPELRARLSYTYMRAMTDSDVTIRNRTAPALVYEPDELPYRPAHKIDLDLSWSAPFGFAADLSGSYIGDRYDYDHFDPADNARLIARKRRLHGYVLVGLRIRKKLGEHVELRVAGENLFDQKYEEIRYMPGPGIAGWMGVTFRL